MMNYKKYVAIFLIGIMTGSCKTSENSVSLTEYKDSLLVNNSGELSIYLNKGKSFYHPTFVIWVEDMEGQYLKTLFITQSYASGIFEHKMIDDKTWANEPGASAQPAALPYWTHKKGLIDDKYLVPIPEHPFVDAYTGATPKGNFSFKTSNFHENNYQLILEVNQSWDWNAYWTNNKYNDSEAYKHSAQPSLIYSATVNDSDSIFYLRLIGHGDPKGETGKLFSDTTTLTTAKNIFSSLKAETKKQ